MSGTKKSTIDAKMKMKSRFENTSYKRVSPNELSTKRINKRTRKKKMDIRRNPYRK